MNTYRSFTPVFVILGIALVIKPILTEISISGAIHYNFLIAFIVIFSSVICPFFWGRVFILWPTRIFIIYLTFTMLIISDFSLSSPYYFKYISYASIFYLSYEWCTKNDQNSLIKMIVYSAFIPIAYGLVQIASGDYYLFYASWENIHVIEKAISSTFPHPNDFGVFFVGILSVQLSAFINIKARYVWQNWAMISFIIFFIYQSHARVALGGMLAVFFVYILIVLSKRKRLMIIAASLLIMTVALLYFTFFPVDDGSGKDLRSLYWRFRVWLQLVREVEGLAVFIGNGLGYSEILLTGKFSDFNVVNPHSEYVRLYLELGLIGLLLYLYTLSYVITRALRVVVNRVRYSEQLFQLAVMALAINASSFVMNITENNLFNLSYQWIMWVVNAMFFVVRSKEMNINNQTVNR